MGWITGTLTMGTAGSARTFTGLGLTPTYIEFIVTKKTGTDNANHMSIGASDSNNQVCDSVFTDSTGSRSFKSSSRVVSQYERISGTVTEVLAANNVNFIAGGFEVDVLTANSNYQVTIRASDG